MTQNQERAIKEKCEHLELDLKKMEQKYGAEEKGDNHEDTLRDQIISKEMIEDRQGMLGDLQSKQSELFRLAEENKELKSTLFEMEKKVTDLDY